MMMRRLFVVGLASLPLALVLASGGCGGSKGSSMDASPGFDAARLDGPYHPDASCLVTIDTPAFPAAAHVDEGTPVTYSSNPPAGGPHYPRWASFGVHDDVVPRPYWVHDMEHGAVVLLYKCDPDAGPDGGACAAQAKAFLAQVVQALPTDPTCAPDVRVRTVTTADPLIPTPFAAAAWGWTYTSACADLQTLVDFAKAHYAHAPEDECANGSYPP
jgi:hypothetical protein